MYDIFISYKRKSLATANNLYYRLTTRGYSVFFDLEEMKRDNFDIQLLEYIDEAKDVFVILEDGSLDACTTAEWEKDWFCHEIAYALEKEKNIIPVLLDGFKMPKKENLAIELQDLTRKNAPEFSFSYFGEYIDKLIDKGYITSEPNREEEMSSVFKFYSNENCQVSKDGKLVCSIEGNADEPFYLLVSRKGTYRFKCINSITLDEQLRKETIDFDEEKEIEIEWDSNRKPFAPKQEFPGSQKVIGEEYTVELGYMSFKMLRVEGGSLHIGATKEQLSEADNNEHPEHVITLPTYYVSQFPITQNVWEVVMGYNKSKFKNLGKELKEMRKNIHQLLPGVGWASGVISSFTIGAVDGGLFRQMETEKDHLPIENISHDESLEFTRRLSRMTNLNFSLPSEEEWEYAARGGQKSLGYKYAGSNELDEVAWYRGNSNGTTHPVGEKKPNGLGLYDMSGNVWEWTETPAHSYSDNTENPSGDGFIRRGGSWWHEPNNCRVSKRYASDKSKKTSGLGLRVIIRIKE